MTMLRWVVAGLSAAAAGWLVVSLLRTGKRVAQLRDDAVHQRIAADRRAALMLSVGLLGITIYEVPGVEGTTVGEYVSLIGFAIAIAGLLYLLFQWQYRRTR